MQIELKDIKAGELEQEYSCTVDDFPQLQDFIAAGEVKFYPPLEFKLRLQQTGKFVEVDGRLDAVIGLKCGRCLGSYDLPLAENFAFTFVPQPKTTEFVEEVELEAAELDLTTYKDEILDLQDPLQEQLLMAIPISPICCEECLGLCPECGVNMNITRCDCVKKIFNNKFNILSELNLKKS